MKLLILVDVDNADFEPLYPSQGAFHVRNLTRSIMDAVVNTNMQYRENVILRNLPVKNNCCRGVYDLNGNAVGECRLFDDNASDLRVEHGNDIFEYRRVFAGQPD